MCSVTYLPLPNDNFILTSNRDVSTKRKPASSPITINTEKGKIIFPKDNEANGTWIGSNDIGRTIVLLNGGFESHVSNPPYAKSRGLIVRKTLEIVNAWTYLQDVVLTNIEPFTLLIIDWHFDFQLWEFVWDGERKYFKELNKHQPVIYSSSTLYDDAMKAKREQWFEQWLVKNPNYEQASIIDFHETAGEGNPKESILLDRGDIQTVSITSIQKQDNLATVFYHDTIQDSFNYNYFEFANKRKVLTT